MLGIDPKAARAAWTVFLIALAIFVAYMIRHTLVVFTLAIFFAYMLAPAVDFVARFLPARASKAGGLALVYVALIGVLVALGITIGSAVAEEGTNLVSKLPELAANRDPLAAIPLPEWIAPVRARISNAIRAEIQTLDKDAFPLLQKALGQVATRAGRLLEIILVPILAFFFLKDGAAIRSAIISWTTDGRNSVVLDEILAEVHILLGRYIRALFVLSAASFVSCSIFLSVTGGSYSVLLAGIAALLEFIPAVGPLMAAVIILLVEGFAGYSHLLWIAVFLGLYRLFQDYVLAPYLMGTGIELHPLLILFGVLAGERIGGIPGMFLSVPVIAVLRVVYVRLQRNRTGQTLVRQDI